MFYFFDDAPGTHVSKNTKTSGTIKYNASKKHRNELNLPRKKGRSKIFFLQFI